MAITSVRALADGSPVSQLRYQLWLDRALNLGTGVSPLVPLMLSGGALLVWCVWHLRRGHLLAETTPLEFVALRIAPRLAARERRAHPDPVADAVASIREVRSRLSDALPRFSRLESEGAMATVLVVDDERPVRELAARMLQDAGYDTIQAVDGQDAWRQVRRAATTINAIVSDVVMPHMTGTELLARLQADRPESLRSRYSPSPSLKTNS